MPVYEYECKSCGGRHEVMQRISDAPILACPDCQGEVYRILSPSGLSFKGEGWYITDYARKGKDPDSKKEKPADKEPAKPVGENKVEAAKTPSTPDVSNKKAPKDGK